MREIRISIAVIVTILIGIGVVMIYSSSGVYAMRELGQQTYFLKRHLLFLVIGFFCAIAVMSMDYRVLQRHAKPLLLFSMFLLVLVLIPHIGKASFGARRWFKIAGLSFQPSELAKLAVLIYTADYLSRKRHRIRYFWEGFLPLIMVLGANCLLILKQPDFGTSVLISSMVLVMIFVAGGRLRHIATLILLSLPLLYLLVFSVPYRLKRIMAFVDPWQDSQGVGFQLTQSQIALGSGGLWGVGLGKSVQKLFYLPAAHTDFILSIIGEELGWLGTFAVIILFAVFIWQIARVAKRTTDSFGYFLSVGICALLGFQTAVNIGVSIGALPTKGLPLPFVSYGGSALVFHVMTVALLLNISRIEDI